MNAQILINGRFHDFKESMLLKLSDCLLYNESNDNEEKLVLSFIQNNIVSKSYDDLDYHEFMIEESYRISELLCNIENVFGAEMAKCYAYELSLMLNKTLELNTTDWCESISVSEALEATSTEFEGNDYNRFKQLLAAMFLFQCERESYEQTITDSDKFIHLYSVNGFCFNVYEKNGFYILKPVNQVYDCPENRYAKISHVMVPHSLLSSLYLEDLSNSDDLYEEDFREPNITPETFFLKYEQLTGSNYIKEAPQPECEFSGNVSPEIAGKWYQITKTDGFMSMYHVRIDWLKEDGTFVRSMVFETSTPTTARENWSNQTGSWTIKDDQILINDPYGRNKSLESYSLNENILQIGNNILYRNFEEALKHIG